MFEPMDWYDIIDDFVAVASPLRVALIPRWDAGTDFHVNVAAAMVAANMDLTSVDYARRTYLDEQSIRAKPPTSGADLLRESYRLGQAHIAWTLERFDRDRAPATLGEFAAAVAMQRLVTTFKSTHVLYQLGHPTDADAVARVLLEQVAWASQAATLRDNAELEALRPTSSITFLKRIYPRAGVLYGLLSRGAHVDIHGHRAVFNALPEGNTITVREPSVERGSMALLHLADAWATAWESGQSRHMDVLVSVVRNNSGFVLNPERPFKATVNEHLKRVRDFVSHRHEADDEDT